MKGTDGGQLTRMTKASTLKRIWIRVKRRYKKPVNPPGEISQDPSDTSPLIQEVRALFEGRDAIYLEKGAVRVRVSNICGSASKKIIGADVEEIPAPGLGVGIFATQRSGAKPRRWRIGAGHLTTFSDQCWEMGYGGWSLYFHPKAVEGVMELAARFPANLDSGGRYNMIVWSLQDGRDQTFFGANHKRVFPEFNNSAQDLPDSR